MKGKLSAFALWGWVATILSLAGNFYVIGKNPFGFVLWTLSNIILIVRFVKVRDWSQVTLFTILTGINFYGIATWNA